jgi:hypothetical protein
MALREIGNVAAALCRTEFGYKRRLLRVEWAKVSRKPAACPFDSLHVMLCLCLLGSQYHSDVLQHRQFS